MKLLADAINNLKIKVRNYKYIPLVYSILKHDLLIGNFEVSLEKGEIELSEDILKSRYKTILIALAIGLKKGLGRNIMLGIDLGLKNTGLAIALNSVIIWVGTLRDPYEVVKIVNEIVTITGIKPLAKLGVSPSIDRLVSDIKSKIILISKDIIEVKEEDLSSVTLKNLNFKKKLSEDQKAALKILLWRSWLFWKNK